MIYQMLISYPEVNIYLRLVQIIALCSLSVALFSIGVIGSNVLKMQISRKNMTKYYV